MNASDDNPVGYLRQGEGELEHEIRQHFFRLTFAVPLLFEFRDLIESQAVAS
jgi:hypothetical protein